MNKPAAIVVAICCSVLVFVIALAMEFAVVLILGIGFATVVEGNHGGSIGWDPVSVLHLSWHANIAITLSIVLPIVVPFFAARFALRYVSQRLPS